MQRRLAAAAVRGRTLTLKVKRRQAGAPEPRKFLGHGFCDSLSRSVTGARPFGGAGEVAAAAVGLLAAMGIPADELRGLGITVRWDFKHSFLHARGAFAPSNASMPLQATANVCSMLLLAANTTIRTHTPYIIPDHAPRQ